MIYRKNFLELPEDWNRLLKEEMSRNYFLRLREQLFHEYQAKHIRPEISNVFKAFELCSVDKTKIIILGQDPYHNVDQAHGLVFSVPKTTKIPPSLINVFKEISDDLGIKNFTHGCLETWATQGVLLLNAILTVELHKPLSHSKLGWEIFTDFVIQTISKTKENVVFLLWGSFARNKARFIDRSKHCILTAAHPSPLSSSKFFGCKHFSKANDFLQSKNIPTVNWSLR
jgi:uracil-DNA glycosylase